MKIELNFEGIEPTSVNSLYEIHRRGGGTYRKLSEAARASKKAILLRMKDYEEEIIEFNEKIKETPIEELAIKVTKIDLVPENKYRTKKGYMSKFSGDIDSFLKIVFDTITSTEGFIDYDNIGNSNKKRNPIIEGEIITIKLDDKFINELYNVKIPTKNTKRGFIIVLELSKHKELYD